MYFDFRMKEYIPSLFEPRLQYLNHQTLSLNIEFCDLFSITWR